MNVQEIMTYNVKCCFLDTRLSAAATMMWDSDCGALPVLNAQRHVLGMITDRDICMAAATKSKPTWDITVWEAVSGKVYTCQMSDDVHTALDIMEREKIRRLPVLDEDGILQGMLTMNDLILAASEHKNRSAWELSSKDVIRTLKTISAHRPSPRRTVDSLAHPAAAST